MVIECSNLDAVADRLDAAGVHHAGIESVTKGRVLQVSDPDGNRMVFSGP